jgi:hypothetical protein
MFEKLFQLFKVVSTVSGENIFFENLAKNV